MNVLLRDLLNWTAVKYGFPVRELKSPMRYRELALARQVFCWLAAEHSSASLPQIGRSIGRDHTTVLYARDKIASLISSGALVVDFDPSEIESMNQHRNPWTEERIAELKALTNAGLTSAQIGAKMGVRDNTIRYRQMLLGIRSKHKGFEWTPEREVEMKRLRFEEGMSFHEIGLQLGCDEKSVRRRFLYLGLSTERVQVTSAPKAVMRVPSLPPKAAVPPAYEKKPASKAGERDRYYRADPDLLAGLGRAAKARLKHHDLNTLASIMGLHPSTIEHAMEAV